mmetsp:Transcript_79780/g.231568  ORF Transcript_79780/g.231568 Transcript_79780/m.231568 type:complete len:228 (-) Transcript_79780:22-705(-)
MKVLKRSMTLLISKLASAFRARRASSSARPAKPNTCLVVSSMCWATSSADKRNPYRFFESCLQIWYNPLMTPFASLYISPPRSSAASKARWSFSKCCLAIPLSEVKSFTASSILRVFPLPSQLAVESAPLVMEFAVAVDKTRSNGNAESTLKRPSVGLEVAASVRQEWDTDVAKPRRPPSPETPPAFAAGVLDEAPTSFPASSSLATPAMKDNTCTDLSTTLRHARS